MTRRPRPRQYGGAKVSFCTVYAGAAGDRPGDFSVEQKSPVAAAELDDWAGHAPGNRKPAASSSGPRGEDQASMTFDGRIRGGASAPSFQASTVGGCRIGGMPGYVETAYIRRPTIHAGCRRFPPDLTGPR